MKKAFNDKESLASMIPSRKAILTNSSINKASKSNRAGVPSGTSGLKNNDSKKNMVMLATANELLASIPKEGSKSKIEISKSSINKDRGSTQPVINVLNTSSREIAGSSNAKEFINIKLSSAVFNKNDAYTIPLIEKIIIAGIRNEEVKKLDFNILAKVSDRLERSIISENDSIHIKDASKCSYTSGITSFIFNNDFRVGFITDENASNEYCLTHSFTLFPNNLIRKHCVTTRFYEVYFTKDEKKVYSLSSITFCSDYPMYDTFKELQQSIIKTLLNNRKYAHSPESMNYVYLKHKPQPLNSNGVMVNECHLFQFYCAFMLNSLIHLNPLQQIESHELLESMSTGIEELRDSIHEHHIRPLSYNHNGSSIANLFKNKRSSDEDLGFRKSFSESHPFNQLGLESKGGKSVCITSISNNYNKKVFILYNSAIIEETIYRNSLATNQGNNQKANEKQSEIVNQEVDYTPFPIHDVDNLDIIKYFEPIDLIKLYFAMLCEYKILILFNNVENINTLIYSLVSLLYPFKWDLPIISFIDDNQIDMIETPFSSLIGVPISMKTAVLKNLRRLGDDVVVYNLASRSYEMLPSEFPEVKQQTIKSLKTELEQHYSVMKSKEKTMELFFDLFPSFSKEKYDKVNTSVLLKLKLNQIFFKFNIKTLLSSFLKSINMNKAKQQKIALTTAPKKGAALKIHEIFDNIKFIGDHDPSNDKNLKKLITDFSKSIMFNQFLYEFLMDEKVVPTLVEISLMPEKEKSQHSASEHSTNAMNFKSLFHMVYDILNPDSSIKSLTHFLDEGTANMLYSYYSINYYSLDNLSKKYFMLTSHQVQLESKNIGQLRPVNDESICNIERVSKHKIPVSFTDFQENSNFRNSPIFKRPVSQNNVNAGKEDSFRTSKFNEYSTFNNNLNETLLKDNNMSLMTFTSSVKNLHPHFASKVKVGKTITKYSYISNDIKRLKTLPFFEMVSSLREGRKVSSKDEESFSSESDLGEDENMNRNIVNLQEPKLKSYIDRQVNPGLGIKRGTISSGSNTSNTINNNNYVHYNIYSRNPVNTFFPNKPPSTFSNNTGLDVISRESSFIQSNHQTLKGKEGKSIDTNTKAAEGAPKFKKVSVNQYNTNVRVRNPEPSSHNQADESSILSLGLKNNSHLMESRQKGVRILQDNSSLKKTNEMNQTSLLSGHHPDEARAFIPQNKFLSSFQSNQKSPVKIHFNKILNNSITQNQSINESSAQISEFNLNLTSKRSSIHKANNSIGFNSAAYVNNTNNQPSATSSACKEINSNTNDLISMKKASNIDKLDNSKFSRNDRSNLTSHNSNCKIARPTKVEDQGPNSNYDLSSLLLKNAKNEKKLDFTINDYNTVNKSDNNPSAAYLRASNKQSSKKLIQNAVLDMLRGELENDLIKSTDSRSIVVSSKVTGKQGNDSSFISKRTQEKILSNQVVTPMKPANISNLIKLDGDNQSDVSWDEN